MRKMAAFLLALALCLSLCTCGKENDPSSATEEIFSVPDTSSLSDILCGGKWVSEYDGPELVFNANGTFSWSSREGAKEAAWSYHSYYNSSADLPIPISAVLSEDSFAYWGKVDGFTGHNDFVVGYGNAGALTMSFHGQSWIKEP